MRAAFEGIGSSLPSRQIVLRSGTTVGEQVTYTANPQFLELLGTTGGIIEETAGEGIEDAATLPDRYAGWNNLQGHMVIVPLTVWLVWHRPDLLRTVRVETDLNVEMARNSHETSGAFWEDVKDALIDLLAEHGDDRLVVGERANSPETPVHIATTYLSDDYGGGQTEGGGGTMVVKRTLKLLAHRAPPNFGH